MADPAIPVNCQKCGLRLRYLRTLADGVHLYRCLRDGIFKLSPAGLEPDTSEIVH